MAPTPEQAAQMKGKEVLILSHSKWNPDGLTGSRVANICLHNGFFKEGGCVITLVTPDDEADKVYQKYVEKNLIHAHLTVPDMYEETGGASIAEAAKKTGKKYDAVFSHFEHLQPVIGEVAELLNIKHNPYKAYQTARDKFMTRKALEAAGVPTPKAMGCSSSADIPKLVEYIGFPMIVKPTSGAGSLGVYKAFDEAELEVTIDRCLKDLTNNVYLSTNVGLASDSPIVVEQLLIPYDFDGLPVGEFDCDLIFWDGELKYGCVTDNWKPISPYYLENGNTFPSMIPQKAQDELIDYCARCVTALGFYKGAFHMEALYTKDGPMLIECNPRVGGGPIVEFNEELNGVNLNEYQMLTTLNIPVDPQPRPGGITKVRNVYYLNCPVTGRLESANFFEAIKDAPGVIRHSYFINEGDEVRGYDTQVPQWIGEFAMESDVDNLIEQVRLCEEYVKIATAAVKVTGQKSLRRPSRRASTIEAVIISEDNNNHTDI
eukprot:CFRG6053T1